MLYRIPAAELGNPSPGVHDLPVFLEWEDPPYSDYVPEFLEANGIVVTAGGKFLLVVHYSDGFLFRVRLSDKQVRQVDLGGYRLISGDGMVITDDRILYVVRPFGSLVAKLRLNAGYTRGRLLSETTDPTFHGPTSAAIAGDRLLVVNSQFEGPVVSLRGRCRASDFPDTFVTAPLTSSDDGPTLRCDDRRYSVRCEWTVTGRRSDRGTGSCWRCWSSDPVRW